MHLAAIMLRQQAAARAAAHQLAGSGTVVVRHFDKDGHEITMPQETEHLTLGAPPSDKK